MSLVEFSFEITGWQRVEAMLRGSYQYLPLIVDQATGKVAAELETAIKKGIRSQAPGGKKFKPLAKSTKKMKKSSKALIHHGDLLGSIRTEHTTVSAGRAWFVGVNRTAKGKDGESLMNIAMIHEFGTKPYQIEITPRMRRWWQAMVIKKVFKGTLHPLQEYISHPGIPARPFLGPTYEVWVRTAVQHWQAYVERDLRRAWR